MHILKFNFFILIVILVQTQMASARVFDMSKESLASYLVFNIGTSTVAKLAFENEANTGYTYSSGVANNTGTDFGLVYTSSYLNFRFGFEMLKPDVLKDVEAKNAGTRVYLLNSEVLAYAPKIGVEANLQKSSSNRSFVFGYFGSGSLTIKNNYSSSTIAPLGDHEVEMTGSTTLMGYGLGYESYMTDTATYIFEVGYRQYDFGSLKYKKAVTTFSGAKAAGDAVNDISSVAKEIKLSGYFVSLGFRIYMF